MTHMRNSSLTLSMLVSLLLVLFIPSADYSQRRGRPPRNPNVTKSIRQIDFRNFTYELGETRIRLRNGKYTRPKHSTDSIMGSSLVSVVYVDFDGDGNEEAAIDVGSFIDGTMGSMEDYFVFTYKDGAPRQIFHESKEKGARMVLQGRSLIISAPFWNGGDAHCCPSASEVITYQWRGAGMARVSRRLRPNT
jgi:hypothetical protein